MRRRDRKNKRPITIAITSTVCVLVLMTAGYAAFSTNLNITAKGNIVDVPHCEFGNIKVNTVTEGDGLYQDEYESEKYVYKGKNPNNYITFNNEKAGWRIISVETDGSIKIMKDGSIGSRMVESLKWPGSGLETYLNGDYYNSLSQTAQNQIVSHNFSIGEVTMNNNDLNDQINDENRTTWTGKIGLATASEYLSSNSNVGSCGTMSLINNNYSTCKNTTWMFNSSDWWTISPSSSAFSEFYVNSNGALGEGKLDISPSGTSTTATLASFGESHEVRPVLYLSSSITLSGNGTSSDPYIIN